MFSAPYDNLDQIESTEREIHRQELMEKKLPLLKRILLNRYVPFLGLFALYALIGLGTPMIWSKFWPPSYDISIESDLRYDCYPLNPIQKLNKSFCNLDKCLWDKLSKNGQISCYYRMERDDDLEKHFNMMPRYFIMNRTDFNYILGLKSKPPFITDEDNTNLSLEPILYQRLTLSIRHYTEKHFSILIKPSKDDEKRWSRYLDYNYMEPNNSIKSEAEISVSGDVVKNNFQLKVKRRSNDAHLFNMGEHSPFVFSEGHIEITTLLINDLLYGLGQSNQQFKHNFSDLRKWSMFNQYHENLTENATSLFGTHPFFMGIDDPKVGNAYGVLLLNTFPMEAIINARPSLTLRTLGGHLEFHFFLGPRPNEVIQQLLNFIHKPFMPPYWSLGFHMCRTNCKTPVISNEAIKNLEKFSIPFESDCGTSLNVPFDDKYDRFVFELNQKNRKWLSAIKPHLISSTLPEKWHRNVLKNKNSNYHGTITGCQKGKETEKETAYYPDWFNEKSADLYANEYVSERANGFILDMNTPVNIENDNNSCLDMLKTYKWNYYYFAKLNDKNPCMDVLFSKSLFNDYQHEHSLSTKWISLHNLYGYKHAQIVYRKSIQRNLRPFIMSLSTFIGSGRYSGHIATPINATWQMLRFSVKQMLDFSLFGIPMTGFPVGGYKGEGRSKPEWNNLIGQWFQLASMQPFMIAYSGLDEIEMTTMDSLKSIIRSAIRNRYQILPYLYTLFFNAHVNGDLVAQPLFFQFPTNKGAYKIEDQYMLGPALMISPDLYQDKSSVSVYFPNGRWYDFYSGHVVWNDDDGTKDMSIVNLNIHLRGGHMLVTQDPMVTTEKARKENPFHLIGGYDKQKKAIGELYMDNGNEALPVKDYIQTFFTAYYNNITIERIQTGSFCKKNKGRYNTMLKTVKLFGIIDKPLHNQINIYEYEKDSHELILLKRLNDMNRVEYDSKFGVLNIIIELDLCQRPDFIRHEYFLDWSYYKWD